MEEDGFQLVRSKRRRRGTKQPPFFKCCPEVHKSKGDDEDKTTAIDLDVVYVKQVASKLLKLAEEIQCSDYFSIYLLPCLVRCFINHNVTELDLVCYGLGNFIKCQIAAYQFALLVCLNLMLKVRCVYVYDPVFLAAERMVIGCDLIGFQLIDTNEECRRTVQRATLFYMPHCDRHLYDNLLAANWGQQLAHIMILGNSLTRMKDTSTGSQINENLPHIASCFEYLDEYSIRNNFKYSDIFNDTSIHVFNSIKFCK